MKDPGTDAHSKKKRHPRKDVSILVWDARSGRARFPKGKSIHADWASECIRSIGIRLSRSPFISKTPPTSSYFHTIGSWHWRNIIALSDRLGLLMVIDCIAMYIAQWVTNSKKGRLRVSGLYQVNPAMLLELLHSSEKWNQNIRFIGSNQVSGFLPAFHLLCRGRSTSLYLRYPGNRIFPLLSRKQGCQRSGLPTTLYIP